MSHNVHNRGHPCCGIDKMKIICQTSARNINFKHSSATNVNQYGIILTVKREVTNMSVGNATMKTKILAGVAGVLLVALGVTGGYLLLSKDKTVTVPDFTDQTRTDVLNWADENKVPDDQLTFDYKYDEEKDKDAVLSQSINPDTKLQDGDVLNITLSDGADPETMFILPDFSGQTKEQVEAWFKEHKFTSVSYQDKTDTSVPEGTFVSINPLEGKTVRRKDTIIVTLSTGGNNGTANVTPNPDSSSSADGKITIPDFSQYTYAQAYQWGSTTNVKMSFLWETSKTQEANTFIRQNPAAGTKVNPGDAVTATYVSGYPVNLVNMVGKTKKDAESWCTTNKLNPVFVDVYAAADAGKIVSMNPSAGIVPETATITFGVSAGYVPINDFTGKTQDEALAYIADINSKYSASAGIKYVLNGEKSTQPIGTVLHQYTNGVEQKGKVFCAPGSTISLTVSGGVTVPDMAGQTEEAFLAKLAQLNLGPGTRNEEYSDTVPAGNLIWNETGAKNLYDKVAYTISIGVMWDGSQEQVQPTPATNPESTPAATEETSSTDTSDGSSEG